MRKLIYIPIIHAYSDMGSAAPALERQSIDYIGNDRWVKHKATVKRFWENMSTYFASLDAANLKIFQDGLPVDGEVGIKIVLKAANQDSANYRIILDLVKRGAVLCKTEDPSLLKVELEQLNSFTGLKTDRAKRSSYSEYKSGREKLAIDRDKFVAASIDTCLMEGESGVLFMGSYHDVLKYLPSNIEIKQVKDREKVNAYFKELLTKGNDSKLKELSDYLVFPPQ